jgi:putative heme-binding domain-containing protein
MRPPAVVLLLVTLLPLAARAADPDSPAAELASFAVADGFDVRLFASEADGVVKPIQIRFDARGRLWVIGSSVYPQPGAGDVPNDKVLILEDADGDGRADKTTVFADGLAIPTGLEVTGDGTGAYVGHGTQLLFLRDTNGDGKADERRVVLRGFGTGDTHQNINSFAWGPGGELWMSQGLSTRSRVETPWGVVGLDRAGLWRFNPRRLTLEPFFGSQAEPQNPWGFVFTDWGEPIVVAGNNSSMTYPVPGLVPGGKDLQLPLIWRNGNGRKCSGGAIVANAHWPRSWQGALVLGGYINNAVWAVNVLDHGAGFALEDRAQPLIRSTSQSFRPVDVKFGPDGALYVCDWYNPIIGHYQASFWDKRRDKTRGRIWRITAKGRPLLTPPRLAGGRPLAEVIDQLKSNDAWTRHFARRVLADAPAEQVATELRRWTAQAGLSDLTLKEALGVYQGHEIVEHDLLARLSRSPNPGARAYAAGVVGAWADRLPDPLALLGPLASDPHPRVRLRAVVSCAYVPQPEAIEVAMAAAEHPTDAFIDYAFRQVVYSLKPQWLEALKGGRLTFGNRPARLKAFAMADGSPDTLAALRNLLAQSSPPPGSAGPDEAARETFFRILADVGDADDLARIVKLDEAPLKARLLPAVADAARLRGVRPACDLVRTVDTLLTDPDEDLRAGAFRLAAAWKLTERRAAAERTARDAGERLRVRRAAAEALPDVAGAASRDVLIELCADRFDPSLRAAAISALARLDLDAAADRAADLLSGAPPDAVAEELLRALLKRADATAALAKSLKAKSPSVDMAKVGLRVLSAVGERHEALAALLQTAAGLSHEPRAFSEAEVAALADEVRSPVADPRRGAEVFRRAEMSCATCHAVNGRGGRLGPDLGNLGTAQTLEFIIGAVLMPNREVKEGYLAHEIRTKSGERYQGYIVSEDARELVFHDVGQDEPVRLRQDAITKRVQRGSPMPPGLTDSLTRSELRDLIAYLASLGRAAPAKTP